MNVLEFLADEARADIEVLGGDEVIVVDAGPEHKEGGGRDGGFIFEMTADADGEVEEGRDHNCPIGRKQTERNLPAAELAPIRHFRGFVVNFDWKPAAYCRSTGPDPPPRK